MTGIAMAMVATFILAAIAAFLIGLVYATVWSVRNRKEGTRALAAVLVTVDWLIVAGVLLAMGQR